MHPFKKMILSIAPEEIVSPTNTYWFVGMWLTGTHETGGTLTGIDIDGVEFTETGIYAEAGCISYYSQVPPYNKIGIESCTP